MGIIFIVSKMHVILEDPSFNLLPKLLVFLILSLPFSLFIPLVKSVNASIIVISTFSGGLFSGMAILSYCVVDFIRTNKP